MYPYTFSVFYRAHAYAFSLYTKSHVSESDYKGRNRLSFERSIYGLVLFLGAVTHACGSVLRCRINLQDSIEVVYRDDSVLVHITLRSSANSLQFIILLFR